MIFYQTKSCPQNFRDEYTSALQIECLQKEAVIVNSFNGRRWTLFAMIRHWLGLWSHSVIMKKQIDQKDSPLTNEKRWQSKRMNKLWDSSFFGHTYLTHAYLLRGEAMPRCVPCDCALTVKYILVDCIDYDHIRQIYYNVPDVKTLFQSVRRSSLILNFLKETNFYKQF